MGKPRFLIVAFLLLVLGAGVLYFVLHRPVADGGESRWPELTGNNVSRVVLASGSDDFALFAKDGEWFVRPGGNAALLPRADVQKLAGLLAAVSKGGPGMDLGRYLPSRARGYGFDRPAVVLRIYQRIGRGEQEFVLTIGDVAPSGEGVYARYSINPDRVFLLDLNRFRLLQHGAAFYFDGRLVDTGENDIVSVELANPRGVLWRIVRRDDRYVFEAPDTIKGQAASAPEMKLYLHGLALMRASGVLLKPVETSGEPEYTFTVRSDKGRAPEQVQLYKAEGNDDAYIGRSTWQPGPFQLDAPSAKQLVRSAFDFQGRDVFDLDSNKIARFRIVSGDRALEVVRSGQGWSLIDGKTPLVGIDMSIWRLTELKFEGEPSAKLPDSAQRALICEFLDKDGKRLQVLTFYNDTQLPDGQCWIKVGEMDRYFPVPSQLLDELAGRLPQ